MEFLTYFNCQERGIVLDDQEIRLFQLLKEQPEEAKNKIKNFLEEYRISNDKSNLYKTYRFDKKIKRIVNDEIRATDKEKRELISLLLINQYIIQDKWNDEKELAEYLNKKKKDEFLKYILEIRNYFRKPSDSIIEFCINKNGKKVNLCNLSQEVDGEKAYKKVKEKYDYIVGSMFNGEKRFNVLKLKGQSNFLTVCGSSSEKEYNLSPLKRAINFAKENKMEVNIDAICYYRDFPDFLCGKTKEEYIRKIEKYAKILGDFLKKEKNLPKISANIFKQFVNQYEPFDIRKNNWHNRISIEEFCDIALYVKSNMPNVEFSYSDIDFDNDEKRKNIFEVLDKIQKYEKQHGICGKILSKVEMEYQFNETKDAEDFGKTTKEIKKRYHLPIEILIKEKIKDKKLELSEEDKEVLDKYRKWKINEFLNELIKQQELKNIEKISFEKVYKFEKIKEEKEKKLSKEELKIVENINKKYKEIIIKNNNIVQDFNYHTHTRRCGHAEDVSDEEFIKKAIESGMKALAFTDHIPFAKDSKHCVRPRIRMDYEEIDEYLHSILYYKKKYKGVIDIQTGFEFEYTKVDKEYLKEIRKKVDKMVLGQHFVLGNDGKEYRVKVNPTDEILDIYADSIIEAMQLKLVDIVVHPDYFLSGRDGFYEKEEIITRRICSAAQKYGIPFEINLGQLGYQRRKREVKYPNREFWKIASEYDIGVIYGKDAHFTEQISDQSVYETANQIIGKTTINKLKFLQKDLQTEREKIKSIIEQIKDIDNEISDKERKNVMKDLIKINNEINRK